ncbi:MAG: DUF1289 domain-containing protein [Pseudomonadota bacterium]|nr:DUF1289 domain-containing protein [Pseudomonadales bacterium]MDY6920281.1 DUF1289 domain-containing protein [Pseudomonadota bacterium]
MATFRKYGPSGGTPESPCVRNCCLDNRDICLGCGRTLEEILHWNQYSPQQREQAFRRASQRRDADSTPHFPPH